MTEQVRWYVGIDWARNVHRVCLFDAEGKRIGAKDVAHEGAALGEMCAWLIDKTAAQPAEIAVAIETPRGPIVELLLERGFVVYAINPKQLDRFRDRFTVAGAKDDDRDADVLGTSLRTDRHAFRRLSVDDALIVQIREWSRIHDEFQQQRTRLANRVREHLWRYYPQAAKLTDDVAAAWFLDLWEKVSTPAKAARVSEKTVAGILKNHRIRRFDAAEALRVLRAQPLWVAPGTTEAATAHIAVMVVQLRLINQQISDAERRLDELSAAIEESAPGQICEQRDVAILRSCPGLGRINIATLLGEACEPLRQRDYHALRLMCGQAPVTRRSGKTCIVLRRHACNQRLRNVLFHWSRVAIQHDPVSKRRYAELRERGKTHSRALRTVGDRLLYVLCTLLERQTLFDRNRNGAKLAVAA